MEQENIHHESFYWFFFVVFCCFYCCFCCLESMVGKYIWIRTTFFAVILAFWKCYPENCLIITIFEVFSQQLWGTLTTSFRKTTCNWRFYRHGSTYMLILSSRLEKTSWNENRWSCWKLTSSTKIRAWTSNNIAPK